MNYIGLFGRPNGKYTVFNQEICSTIFHYKYQPLGIIVDFNNDPQQELERLFPLLMMCEGFILQGGDDFYNFDILLTSYLHTVNKPTLGICLGMQQMGVSFQGEMKNINHHLSNNQYVHEVTISKQSKLYSIIKKDYIMVNSRHKSYITHTSLPINAIDTIIEGVEDPNKDFFLGVQWHPESLQDENSQKLFDDFFLTIKNRKK